MQSIIYMLPKVAKDTQKSLTSAMGQVKNNHSLSQKFNPIKLAEYLSSKYNEDLIEAVKILIGIYFQNRMIDVYLSRVINLLPRDDFELKRLCQILITEVAAHTIEQRNTSQSQGDVLLLSISPIYRDIVSFNTGTKLYALKTLPLMNVEETSSLLMASLKQMVSDKNQLVRRTGATTIMKLYDITKGDIDEEDYKDAIEFLLKDSPQVRCAAIAVLMHINSDSTIKWMHSRYFSIVKDLHLLNNFDMERTIRYLHRYALQYFTFCRDGLSAKRGQERAKDVDDLIILLDKTERLLKLPYPSIIVSVAQLHLDFPQESRLKNVIKTLTRFLNISSESKYIVLQILNQYAIKYPHLMKEYYRAFTINQIEKQYCKIKKLEIMYLLIDENNYSIIIEELLHHTRSNSPYLASTAVRLLGYAAQLIPKYLKKTIRILAEILRTGTDQSKNYAVEAFCRIMDEVESPQLLPLLTLCLQYIEDVSDIRFKCHVIRLLNREHQIIPSIAAENLRKLSISYLSQHENVKYEILNLAFSLNQFYTNNNLDNESIINTIFQYILTLSQFDSSILLRDLARSLKISTISIIQDESSLYKCIAGKSVINNKYPTQNNKLFRGLLSDIIQVETKETDYEIHQESTFELRKVQVQQQTAINKPEPKQDQILNSKPSKPLQQQQQQQLETVKQLSQQDVKQQRKLVEEEVVKHYNNLGNVLNDFFVDDD